MTKNHLGQGLVEALQVRNVLLENLVNDSGIDAVVEVNDSVSKCDHGGIVIGRGGIEQTRVSEGEDDIGSMLRGTELERTHHIGGNVEQGLNAGLQPVQGRIEVAHVGQEICLGQAS